MAISGKQGGYIPRGTLFQYLRRIENNEKRKSDVSVVKGHIDQQRHKHRQQEKNRDCAGRKRNRVVDQLQSSLSTIVMG